MSTQLALRYLAKFGIKLKFTTDGSWQLGKTVFKPLEAHTGGYQNIDAWGHQILLNYRSHRSITEIAPQITLGEVLAGQLNAEAVKDRIVIIGTTAPSFKDFSSHLTKLNLVKLKISLELYCKHKQSVKLSVLP